MPRRLIPRAKMFRSLRYLVAAAWFLFTVSLTGWWVIFGLQQIDNLMELDHADKARMVRQQKMLLWEGGALFLLLTAGAGALGYFMMRERREAEQVQKFLATFTHELKTPLASLRLQAEALREDLSDAPADVQRLLGRLVADTARLTLQLDNSLFLADLLSGRSGLLRGGRLAAGSETLTEDRALRMELVALTPLVGALAEHWPHLTVVCVPGVEVQADRRALESVFLNLFQNAISHGKARNIDVAASVPEQGWVLLTVRNDGTPFVGDASKLGQLFQRFYQGSGSGIGLHLVRTLMAEMGGSVTIVPSEHEFVVQLRMRGSVSGI